MSTFVTTKLVTVILALLCACTPEVDLDDTERSDPVESVSETAAAGSEDAVIALRRSLMAAPLSVTRLYVTEEATDPGPPPGGILRLRAQVQADSSDHRARLALAEALRRDRDYAGAEEHYREAILLRSGHTGSYVGLARLLITLSRDDDAAEILEAAVNAARPTLQFHSLRGSLALRRERYDQAVASFREAVDMDPSRDRAHYDLAGALERQGSISTAITALRRGLAHVPGSIELSLRLAELLAATGDHDQALEMLRSLIEANPSLTRAYLASARIHRQRGDMEAARDAVDAGLEIESSYVDLIAELGILLVDGGQEGEAIPHLERAVISDPDLLEACSALGLAYERTGDLDRAQLVKEHTEHLRDHEEALRALKTSIALDRRDAAAFFAAGDLYTHLVRPVAAAQALEVGLRIVPDNTEALSNLGLVLLSLQQLPRAIETYEKVIALDPTSVSAYANLGNALAGSGQHERAIAAFQRALALDPDLAPAHLGLARLYEKLGRADEAQAARSEFERLRESAVGGAADAP